MKAFISHVILRKLLIYFRVGRFYIEGELPVSHELTIATFTLPHMNSVTVGSWTNANLFDRISVTLTERYFFK